MSQNSCATCLSTVRTFNNFNEYSSSSFQKSIKSISMNYGSGSVNGLSASDLFWMGSTSFTQNFVLVQQQTGLN